MGKSVTQTPRSSLVKSGWQILWDAIGIPFRLVLLDQAWLPRFGWTTLEEERIRQVLPWIHGRLLDVGAGPNHLVHRYGSGCGVDVHDWGGGSLPVADSASLPFKAHSFDTVTFLACLNHIPNRMDALVEAKRVIKPGGRLIITMIDPILGGIGHAIWWFSEDKKRGGMVAGEVGGLWNATLIHLAGKAGFELETHRRFVYGMNNILVFRAL
jgi:SAM-dependent methyltransferase